MSSLGKCPTCDGKVSMNSTTCPHCGERNFLEVTDVDGKKTVGWYTIPMVGPFRRVVDLRNGAQICGPREWPPPQSNNETKNEASTHKSYPLADNECVGCLLFVFIGLPAMGALVALVRYLVTGTIR